MAGPIIGDDACYTATRTFLTPMTPPYPLHPHPLRQGRTAHTAAAVVDVLDEVDDRLCQRVGRTVRGSWALDHG